MEGLFGVVRPYVFSDGGGDRIGRTTLNPSAFGATPYSAGKK